MLNNSLAKPIKQVKKPCFFCQEGLILKTDEETGKEKLVKCENCDNGYVEVDE